MIRSEYSSLYNNLIKYYALQENVQEAVLSLKSNHLQNRRNRNVRKIK